MFKLESDIDKATRRLERSVKNGIPTAIANTLDNVAFNARNKSNELFERDHVIRSNWTQRGTRFEKTQRSSTIAKMESRTGSIRDYAEVLEEGGTVTPRKKNLMAPALGARGGNKRRKIRPTVRLARITPRRMPNVSGSPTKRFAAMLNIARKENYYGPFIITKQDAGGERLPIGIFNLKRAGRRKRGGGQIVMIRKIQTKATITGHSFIEKGANKASGDMAKIYIKNAQRLLK